MSDEVREVQTYEAIPADGYEVTTYPAPRGAWDFTEAQRIALSFLIWLNIIVIVVGYRALTGHISL